MITILLLVSGPGGRCSAAAGFQSKSPVRDIVSDIVVIMHIDFRFVMLISLSVFSRNINKVLIQ